MTSASASEPHSAASPDASLDGLGCRIFALRKPKTNIQILQQNVLLKQKHLVGFLRQHGQEVFGEVRAAYVDTLSRVLSSHFRAYLAALERLQVSSECIIYSCECLASRHYTCRKALGCREALQTEACVLPALNDALPAGLAARHRRPSGCDWRGCGQRRGRRGGQPLCPCWGQHASGASGCLRAGGQRGHPAPPRPSGSHTACGGGRGPQGTRRCTKCFMHDEAVDCFSPCLQSLVGLPLQAVFRSVSKLLMDTATSEYLFCCSFFQDDAIFHELFAATLAVVESALAAMLQAREAHTLPEVLSRVAVCLK